MMQLVEQRNNMLLMIMFYDCHKESMLVNKAYAKLLPKESQSLPITPHYLCQLSNISECLPIEKQDRVNTIILGNFLL
jgi:hypothetical protein